MTIHGHTWLNKVVEVNTQIYSCSCYTWFVYKLWFLMVIHGY